MGRGRISSRWKLPSSPRTQEELPSKACKLSSQVLRQKFLLTSLSKEVEMPEGEARPSSFLCETHFKRPAEKPLQFQQSHFQRARLEQRELYRQHELKMEHLALPFWEHPTTSRRWSLFPRTKPAPCSWQKAPSPGMNSTLEADQVFLSTLSQLRTLQIANTHLLQLRAELAEAVEALLNKKRMLAEILIR